MQTFDTDIAIVGAGPSGVVLSYFLQQHGYRHLLLERYKAFSSWYSRWRDFRMNTANWMNVLPGGGAQFVPGAPGSGLATREQALRYFEDYLERIAPPIEENFKVLKVSGRADGSWMVQGERREYHASKVVLCTGALSKPYIPALAERLPDCVWQCHALNYVRPDDVPGQSAVVVGGGSSGTQISANLLRESAKFRNVFLAKSANIRFPWRIFGIPVHSYARAFGVFDIKSNSPLGRWCVARALGRGDPAAPPHPRELKRQGVNLRGRLLEIEDGHLVFSEGQPVKTENLSVVWCTGMGPDWPTVVTPAGEYRPAPGNFVASGGLSGLPGLYFLGQRFQRTLSSHTLYGLVRDAGRLAAVLCADN